MLARPWLAEPLLRLDSFIIAIGRSSRIGQMDNLAIGRVENPPCTLQTARICSTKGTVIQYAAGRAVVMNGNELVH